MTILYILAGLLLLILLTISLIWWYFNHFSDKEHLAREEGVKSPETVTAATSKPSPPKATAGQKTSQKASSFPWGILVWLVGIILLIVFVVVPVWSWFKTNYHPTHGSAHISSNTVLTPVVFNPTATAKKIEQCSDMNTSVPLGDEPVRVPTPFPGCHILTKGVSQSTLAVECEDPDGNKGTFGSDGFTECQALWFTKTSPGSGKLKVTFR